MVVGLYIAKYKMHLVKYDLLGHVPTLRQAQVYIAVVIGQLIYICYLMILYEWDVCLQNNY